MKILTATRKEDDLYFSGVFWIIADSFEDYLHNNYSILAEKHLVDYEGNEISKTSHKAKTHKKIWENEYKDTFGVDYDYYPRGRISVYKGKLYLNLHSKLMMNQRVIPRIIKEYELDKFDINRDLEVNFIDEEGTDHYNFKLE